MEKELKILIVEDLDTDAELVKMAIKKNGILFTEHTVETEKEFTNELKTFSPDIVLSDYSLPQFNGTQALRIKEEIAPWIPFILVTGTINEDTAVECMKSGADDYIIKQNLTRLGLAIKEAIKKKEIIRLKKKAEDELIISEKKYKQLYEQSPIGYQSLDENGLFLIVNRAWLDTMGYSENEVIGKWFGDFLTPEYRELFVEKFESFKSLGQIHSEFEMIRKDGIRVYIEFEGKIVYSSNGAMSHAQCVINDTTEKRRAAQALKESEERFRSLFENSPFAYFSLDESGNFIDVNDMLCELLEYDKQEIIGKKFVDLWSTKTKHLFQDIIERFVGIGSITAELNLTNKNNEPITVLLEGRVQRDQNRYFQRSHCILYDITTRKQVEDELEQRNKNLQFLNNLSLKLTELSPKEDIAIFLAKQLKEFTEAALVIYFDFNPQNKSLVVKHIQSSKTIISSLIRITGISKKNTVMHIPDEIYHQMITSTISTKKSLSEISFGLFQGKTEQELDAITGITRYYGISLVIGSDFFGYFLIGQKNDHTLIQKGLLESFAHIGAVSYRRKLAEDALYESEEKFRSLFENHSAVKLIIDPKTRNIIDANNAAAFYYGWNRDELKQMKIDQISLHKPKGVADEIEKFMFATKTLSEFRHRRADGTIRDVEVFSSKIEIGNTNYLHSIIHDITERKRAEDKLKTLNSAVEQNPTIIMIVNPNGEIEYVNPMFTEVTGYAIDEVIGKNPRLFKSGEHSKEFYQNLWSEIAAGRQWKGELHNRKKNGDLYWEEAIISPIFNEDGVIAHFVAVKEDITEKKKMLDDLLIAKEKAEESDRLKTAFLHNISHEVRTPMNAIMGFSAFLNDPDLSPDTRKNYIEVINLSSNRLLSIISDIISISTIESGQEKIREREVNLYSVLKNVKEKFASNAQKSNIKFDFSYPPFETETVIITDDAKLIQIFSNLIDNALKFTRQGSVYYGYSLQGDFLEFYVEDTGIGIAEEYHELIFNRFRQANANITQDFGGTGLGLSISKAYVELLGGTIWLESQLGKGAKFYFTIPCKRKHKPEKDTSPIIDFKIATPNRAKTILVAEDEDINFQLISELLSKLNANIIRAENGLVAVEICKTNEFVDLVVMDIKMPIKDGYEATREIKAFRPELTIIAQTAFSFEADKAKALEAGCSDFISKPFKKEDFIGLVSKYL